MSKRGEPAELRVYKHVTPYATYCAGEVDVLAKRRTAFQDVCLVGLGDYGKTLIIDGLVQSSTIDEFVYHESLVHPAFAIHGSPASALIIGGGEGATLREALKWRTMKRAVMVDIDGELVELCKEILPEMHQGAFDDPRAELVVDDALKYIRNVRKGEFDVVISDLSEPVDEGPSRLLFTKEYFQRCSDALSPGGCMVVQSGSVSPNEACGFHSKVASTMRQVFPHICHYASMIDSFSTIWGFVIGSKAPIDERPCPRRIDELISKSVDGPLRMFDGRTMLGLMNPPKYIRKAVDEETTVYTDAAPPNFEFNIEAGLELGQKFSGRG